MNVSPSRKARIDLRSLTFAACVTVFAGAAQGKSFIAVSTADADRAAAWYERHLDLKVVSRVNRKAADDPAEARILDGEAVMVEVLQHKDASAPSPAADAYLRHGHFKAGFQVKDLDSWLARWRSAGVSIRASFCDMDIPMAVIEDGDGNLLHVLGPPKTGSCSARP